jgi:hypothetical protein
MILLCVSVTTHQQTFVREIVNRAQPATRIPKKFFTGFRIFHEECAAGREQDY